MPVRPYVVASYGPRFFSTVRFVKNSATCENFLGKRFTPPPPLLPGEKFPLRLWSPDPGRAMLRRPVPAQTAEKVLELGADTEV